jgi:uncharacterized protein (TIGR03083 family)
VLYLHGGAYISPMSPQHWALVGRLADAGVRVDVPLYGLAPQHTYREACDLVLAAYSRMADDPLVTTVTIMGDSAGGGLALGIAQVVATTAVRQPDRLCLIAPWLDLTLANPRIAEVDDPWLSPAGLAVAGAAWAGGDDPRSPRLSPIGGPLQGLPPTDIYVGTRDILLPDVERFVALACDAGAQVELTVEPGAVHVYPLVPVPEGRRARARIVALAAGRPTDTADEVFAAVARRRRAVADLLDDLDEQQLATASLCAGWDVGTVAAHLADAAAPSLVETLAALIRARGRLHEANDQSARRAARRPVHETAELLRQRASSRFTPPVTGPRAPLAEVLVHEGDMRVPLGLPYEPEGSAVRVALEFVTTGRPVGFVPRGRLDGLRLVADDLPWAWGQGAVVEGRGIDLLLAACGRTAALHALRGPGADVLSGRLDG